MNLKSIFASLVLVSWASTPCLAQQSIIRISGHSWETGGFPTSQVNDEFQAVGIVNEVVAPLFWQPTIYSYTFAMRDLMSLGETVFGTTSIVSYAGGQVSFYRDALPSNHVYGINPPNATAPSTFEDGTVYLEGSFTDFTLTFNTTTSSGSFTGTVNFTGGIVFPNLVDPTGWTLGSDLAGVSPTGYDLQLNGNVYLNGPIAVESLSWSRAKALYR